MPNPSYGGGFHHFPMPERIAIMRFLGKGETADSPIQPSKTNMLSVGVKTMTRDTQGLAIVPHKVVAIELCDGDNLLSFALNGRHARAIAEKLNELAQAIEGDK
jgi:hypothetical protein